jgi:hypothetical protein
MRLRRLVDKSKSQAQLAMNLIDEARRYLRQIEEAQTPDRKFSGRK